MTAGVPPALPDSLMLMPVMLGYCDLRPAATVCAAVLVESVEATAWRLLVV